MTDRPDHAREIRYALVDARALCESLGYLAGKGSWTRQAAGVIIRCPWHEDRSPSCSVRTARDGTLAARCHACGATGDALSLVAAAHKLDLRRDFRTVLRHAAELAGLWAIVAEIDTGDVASSRAVVAPPRPEPEPERDFPAPGEVEAFWERLGPTADEPEVAEYLRGRRLDPDGIDSRDLARAIGRNGDCPRWAVCKGGTWAEAGYRLIVPMFDVAGALRSVRGARVIAGDGPKRLPPFGHKASGLVMADVFGLAMLRGQRTPERIVICEGEPDFLVWATHTTDPNTAVLGIVSGSWGPAFAARMPKGARVIIRTDPDPPGEKYAREIAGTLKGRCFVRRAA